MKLKEAEDKTLLFSSDQLKLITRVQGQSSLNGLQFSGISDKDQTAIKRILRNVKNNSNGKNSCNDFCILKALQQGPDTSKNNLIRYVLKAPVEAWRAPDKVLLAIELGVKGAQGVSLTNDDNFLPCLTNKRIYSDRNLEDFRYTLMAFDAIINKKARYFDGDKVKLSLSAAKLKKFFNSETAAAEVEQEPDNIIPFPNRNANESLLLHEAPNSSLQLQEVEVDISVKYLYKKFEIDNADSILSAGVKQNSNERTIWNYMELWSNPSDETSENKADRGNNQSTRSRQKLKQNIANQITDKIKNSNMNKQTQGEIIDLLSRMP